MAGDYYFTLSWIAAYEEASSSWISTTTTMVDALNHYGDILVAIAYNWDISNQTIPQPDRPTPTPPVGYPYTAAHDARGANGDGIKVKGVGFSKIEVIPNGDSIKLQAARDDGWLIRGRSGEVTSAPTVISATSRTFDYSTEETVIDVRDRLDTLEKAATAISDAAKIVQAAVADYHGKLESLRTSLQRNLESRKSNKVLIFESYIYLECAAPIFDKDLKEFVYDPVDSSEFHTVVTSAPFLKLPDLGTYSLRLKEIIALPIKLEDEESGSSDDRNDADGIALPVMTVESESYVRSKHYPGGALNTPFKSTFDKGEDPYALVDAAKNSPAIPQGDGTYRREVFVPDRYIGHKSEKWGGEATQKYIVVQDRFGAVITMHPEGDE
ncbi:hypothetical protein [Nocardia salmonicida]|uniref:hypothetical protein n=1 Tax=Nocardia salmonicida TaxID=53431 RepID=UPI00341056C3